MIQLVITATSKSYSPASAYSIHATQKKVFADIAAAKAWLREKYGTCKRVKMFRDADGTSRQIGWIYCYKDEDMSHLPREKWLQQNWVEFQRIEQVEESKLRGR